MLYLLRKNGAYTHWFLGLVCLAKAVADEEPERWHGHLVTSSGTPLTEDDLVELLPAVSRKHRVQVRQFVEACLERGLLRRESCANDPRMVRESCANHTRTDRESLANHSRIDRESSANVLRITTFTRWWRAPEKRAKPNTGAELPKAQQPQKAPPPKTDFPQADALQTDIQTDRQIPPTPQGEPAGGREGAISKLDQYQTINPDTFGDPIEDYPEDTSKDEKPASSDPSKLSSLLTCKQQKILRGRADQHLQQLSPGGLARGQQEALHRYLDTLPPQGWKDPPTRWAEYLCHWIQGAVAEVSTALAERKDHGIGNPAAVAIGRAKTLAAEKIAEARARTGKRG